MMQLRASLINANVVQVGDSNNNFVIASAAAIDAIHWVIHASTSVGRNQIWHFDFNCKKSSSYAMNFAFARNIAV